jgi:hypothetical protein
LGDLTALDKNSWDGYGTVLLCDAAKPAKTALPPSGGGHDTPKRQSALGRKKPAWYNRVI